MEMTTHKIRIQRTENSRLPQVDFNHLPFGKVFSDHMLIAHYDGKQWSDPEIMPYGKLLLEPSTSALHYGQAIFEGMKAYKTLDGQPVLFRPIDNFHRFNNSAKRMCMPAVPEDIFMEGLKALVSMDREWIPTSPGSSLYIRPFMFATDECVGVRASDTYTFITFCSPVGAYYSEPVNLTTTTEFVRAFEGGTGEAKAAGNYGGSLLAARRAQEEGYHQILWLDGKHHRYIEESGTMNVFVVIDGKALTPSFDGTILHGVTRDSVLKVLSDLGIPAEERPIRIDELIEASNAGKLEEAFGAGTAATIAHVNKIRHMGTIMQLPPVSERKVGPAVMKRLADIRTGLAPDPYGWVVKV